MRFELGLRELADLTPDEAKEKLAALPKGISTGVIIKALQTGQVPSVTIAWSEDKRVINEIEDGLTDLGFRCHVIDHGFFVLRIGTALAEALGRSRYRKKVKEDRSYISLGEQKRKGPMSDLALHALILLLQVVVVEGLYVWRLGIKLGAVNLSSAKDLSPQLGACAAGVFVAYVLTTTVYAWRKGKVSAATAAPIAVLATACTIGALFFMKAEHEAAREKRAIGRPTSNPYAGLLVELRRRGAGSSKLAGSQNVQAGQDAYGEDSEALECFDPSEIGQFPECLATGDWETSQACLPNPPRPKRPRIEEPKPVRIATVAPKVRRVVAPRPFGLTFELVHLSELVLVWMLSLLAVYGLASRKRKKSAEPPAALPEPVAAAPAVNQEVEQLKAALTEAYARLQQQNAGGDAQALQQKLAETQASLVAHQNAIAKFKQQVGPIKEMQAAQVAEIERLRGLLQQVAGRAPQQMAPQAPANTQGAARRAPPAAPAASAQVDPRAQKRRP